MGATGKTDSPPPGGFRFSRVLVTGAGGFVGSHLLSALAERLNAGATITIAGRTSGRSGGLYRSIAFDLENHLSVAAAVRDVRPDLIVHLAAQSSVGRSVRSSAQTWEINMAGSYALARAVSVTVPDCTVLFASSAEVFGLTFNQEVASEDSPLRPQSAYARSKSAAELMFKDVLPETARLIVARPCNHSGPGQTEDFVIPSFAAQIARIECGAEPVVRVGNLEAERDFLDVQDVVNAYISLLQVASALPMRSTFNIASGNTVPISHVLNRLLTMSTVRISIEEDLLRMRPSEVARAGVDPSKIMEETGWKPRQTLDEMLLRTLAYQRDVWSSR